MSICDLVKVLYTVILKKNPPYNEKLRGGGGVQFFLCLNLQLFNKIAIHDNLELEFEVCWNLKHENDRCGSNKTV